MYPITTNEFGLQTLVVGTENSVKPYTGELPKIKFKPLKIPQEQWPLWATLLAKKAIPEDKGIGDVAARLIGPDVSNAFKKWHLKQFGVTCGCAGRQAHWNVLYPLPTNKNNKRKKQ